jgi:sugar phosphate isomerase/epimerase
MQPNTRNTHHDTRPPVPAELLEAVARALAAALIPPPRAPAPPEMEDAAADFLTAAQLAQRLGISRETVVCHSARKTTRRYPRRFADEFAASGLEVADLAAFAAAWRAYRSSLHRLPVRPDFPGQRVRGVAGQHLPGAADR